MDNTLPIIVVEDEYDNPPPSMTTEEIEMYKRVCRIDQALYNLEQILKEDEDL